MVVAGRAHRVGAAGGEFVRRGGAEGVDRPAAGRPMPSPGADRDASIRRLIAGRDVEDIVVYDVSDCQLYGRKHLHRLTGEQARDAEAAGYRPVVYQSVYWFTLAYIPVKPLGTYLVLPGQTCDDPDGDAAQYRAVRLPMDWGQAAFHYAVAVTLTVLVIALVAMRS